MMAYSQDLPLALWGDEQGMTLLCERKPPSIGALLRPLRFIACNVEEGVIINFLKNNLLESSTLYFIGAPKVIGTSNLSLMTRLSRFGKPICYRYH